MKDAESSRNRALPNNLALATYAFDIADLYWATVLAESLRTFGGRLKDAPIRAYLDPRSPEPDAKTASLLERRGVVLGRFEMPHEAEAFILGGKPYAAAAAESDARGEAEILAFVDSDTIFVREPAEFLLAGDIDLGYRPVQLVNISSRYDQPADEYWARIYDLLQVPPSAVFPMTTTVDGICIRPHFNAGMVITRPRLGLLERWAGNFAVLCSDSSIISLCKQEELNNIYLHQAVLAATVLRMVPRDRMRDLPPSYNYAVFLTDQMAPGMKLPSLDDAVTFRHGQHYITLEKLEEFAGQSRIFQWLKARWRK